MRLLKLPTRRLLAMALWIAAVAIAYFVTGRLLLSLAAPPNGAVTTVWLPSGISVAAMILFGPWVAIGSFMGSVALDVAVGTPWPATVTVAAANAGSELLCYYLVAGRRAGGFSLSEVGDGVRLLLGASAASVVSACVGVTAYVAYGVVPAAEYWPTWLTWAGSAAIGIALITPFLVYSTRPWPPLGSRFLEYMAALAVLVIAGYLWQGPVFSRDADEPTILVILCGLLWTAFRFSPQAMTLGVFAFAVSSVVGAVLRLGQEPPVAAYVAIASLQLMLGGLAMMGYLIAAMVERQRHSAEALRVAQTEVVAQARRAGMAEIAINVLHDIGNVLNSVNVSAGLVTGKLRASKAPGLARAVNLMNEHAADLGEFLTRDEKGRLLPAYLNRVAQALADEHDDVIAELDRLSRNVDHIKSIVATQQDYAGDAAVLEPVHIREVIEDALRISDVALVRGQVAVVRQFADDVPETLLDRTRILRILTNLIGNATHAMAGIIDRPRRLTLRAGVSGTRLRICVQDEGKGIPPEDLTRIFAHRITEGAGEGLGLHGSALAAANMGGTLSAHSGGPGYGSTFTLELPVANMQVSR